MNIRAKNLWTIIPLVSGAAALTESNQGITSSLVGSRLSLIVLTSGPVANASLNPALASLIVPARIAPWNDSNRFHEFIRRWPGDSIMQSIYQLNQKVRIFLEYAGKGTNTKFGFFLNIH